MKCPYVFKKQTEIHTRQSNANPDTGIFNAESTKIIILAEMPDCIEKECAAWKNGQCCFNGGK